LDKLGLRQNTLIIFSGDNGTAAGYPSAVHGRMINGWKGSILEGGSRVPFALAELNPAGGKMDRAGDVPRNNNLAGTSDSARAVGPWKSGDTLPSMRAPDIAQKALEISAEIEPTGTEGVVVTQGGAARGYAIYLTDGKLAFAVRKTAI